MTQPATTANPENPFVISRRFNAALDAMWKAWTEEANLKQWFGPKGMPVFSCTLELKPGGFFHYGMRMPDGKEMWGKWIFREIAPQQRLVFVASFSDAQGNMTRHPFMRDWPRETLSTVTFKSQGKQTEIVLEWLPINATDAERQTFAQNHASMQQGWGGTFEQLEEYLTQQEHA